MYNHELCFPAIIEIFVVVYCFQIIVWLHVGHVLCKQCAVPPPPILIYVFSLVSPTGLAGSEEDKYQLEDKTTVHKICQNNDLLHREISPRMKLVKTALNARVVIFGKAQTDEDGIIQCAIAISNFSMWDKLLH